MGKKERTEGRSVLVTGGAGFIASHVAEGYLERGWSVTIVDDLSSGKKENVPAGAYFVEMDICDDRLIDIFRRLGPTVPLPPNVREALRDRRRHPWPRRGCRPHRLPE